MQKEKKYLIDNPTLIAEWNCDKNNELGLDIKSLTLGSGKKAWWKCEKGHEWQAVIAKINKGRGCPYCSGRKVLKGYNDLATLNRTLAKEWNYEKNGGLAPTDVKANSDKKVWWKCANGHEWQATIGSRNSGGHKCPYCSGRYAIQGENDLQTLYPDLAMNGIMKKTVD